jgi:hypothetical protein
MRFHGQMEAVRYERSPRDVLRLAVSAVAALLLVAAAAWAAPGVFLYRLVTFRLPVFPGWLSYRWLRRRDYL